MEVANVSWAAATSASPETLVVAASWAGTSSSQVILTESGSSARVVVVAEGASGAALEGGSGWSASTGCRENGGGRGAYEGLGNGYGSCDLPCWIGFWSVIYVWGFTLNG